MMPVLLLYFPPGALLGAFSRIDKAARKIQYPLARLIFTDAEKDLVMALDDHSYRRCYIEEKAKPQAGHSKFLALCQERPYLHTGGSVGFVRLQFGGRAYFSSSGLKRAGPGTAGWSRPRWL